MNRYYITLLFTAFVFSAVAQIDNSDTDAFFLKDIHTFALSQSKAYQWLDTLCTTAGPRLSGSQASYDGLVYAESVLKQLKTDKVFHVDCNVPRWHRGQHTLELAQAGVPIQVRSTMLGNSVGTSGNMVTGDIIEVFELDSLPSLSEELKDKIVFFNRPMNPSLTRTFHAYGRAVDQRVFGPSKSGKYGAKAVLVRSMASQVDTIPHTGVTVYEDGVENKIPGIAISTYDAEVLSEYLTHGSVQASISSTSTPQPDTTSYSIVAEIKGSEFPDEIILVGGHIDSWDIGQGAHDDGAGCVQSIQVIETLNALNYQPKRTIRCVLFINEENGLNGGKSYAEYSNGKGEFHLAAIESDAGGFTPRGFSCTADEEVFIEKLTSLKKFENLLEPYDLYLKKGGAGADINPLKSQKGLLIGLNPDSQRYFDYHHTAEDKIENVHPRELLLGGAAMTSLVYLIDQYGL